MITVLVDSSCTACGACLITCPEGALVAAPGRPLAVPGRCTACLACVEICPRDAIAVGDRPGRPVHETQWGTSA